MKTIEEKAFELYPEVSFEDNVASEDTFRTNEIRLLERAAFMRGYEEAMRSIELKKEKPECALNEIEKSSWCTENFDIKNGFKTYTVVDKEDAIKAVNLAFKEGQLNPKVDLSK